MNYKIIIIGIIILICIVWYNIPNAPNNDIEYMKYADDVTLLNKTKIDRIIYVNDINDIIDAIDIADKDGKKLIPRGTKHTMGGHTIATNGIILDMKYFNHVIDFDSNNMNITVEPGMTWTELIYFLDSYGLSPMTLQSYSSFSIGGTISVNAHGITNDYGMHKSIISLKVINWKGDIIECNRNINKELFSLIIGGYGLFGVICEVKLNVVKNVKLRLQTIRSNVNNFEKFYDTALNDEHIEVKFARINITNMNDITLYLFKKYDLNKKIKSNIHNKNLAISKISQLLYKWILPEAQNIRFEIENITNKPLDAPSTTLCRNTLLYESAKPISELYSPLIKLNVTHILQEYFIPLDSFKPWMKELKRIFSRNYKYVKLLNITIRFIKKDDTTLLRYAKDDMYAFVLYYRIDKNIIADNELKNIHNLLTDSALSFKGTFYLPYRHHYSNEQLLKSYGNIQHFLAMKKHYDPYEIFSNLWYEQYKGIIGNYQIEMQPIEQRNTHKYIHYPEDINYDNNYNINEVMSNPYYRRQLYLFLKHVFNVTDHMDLFSEIKRNYKKNYDDIKIFKNLQKWMNNKSTINTLINKYYNLRKQKDEIVEKTYRILKKVDHKTTINGYVSIGDVGRYAKKLKTKLNFTGKSYFINNNSDNIVIEQGSLLSEGNVIITKFGKINDIDIKHNSIDLITCYIGLHHFTEYEIDKILQFSYKVLRNDGVLIIRDHNGHKDIIYLLRSIRTIYNALTNVDLKKELYELRNFRTIRSLSQLLKKYGFYNKQIYETQENDPSENMLICFEKIDNSAQFNVSKTKYHRSLDQTYQTLPEWLSVDIIKQYGGFIEHTPWYKFPYSRVVVTFWKVLFNELSIIKKKCGTLKIFSSYTFMNIVIGLIITFIFIQLGVLAIIPDLIYDNQETDKIMIIIETQQIIDDINIIEQRGIRYFIELPRYKKFTQLVIKLAESGTKFIEIAKQTEIQIKIHVPREDFDKKMNDITEMNGLEYLFKYNILDNDYLEVALNINVINLGEIICKLLDLKIHIEHIFDY